MKTQTAPSTDHQGLSDNTHPNKEKQNRTDNQNSPNHTNKQTNQQTKAKTIPSPSPKKPQTTTTHQTRKSISSF